MGEIVGLSVGGFEFMSYKNTFGDLLSIFSKDDLKIEEAVDDDGEVYHRYYFTTTVFEAKKCLDCLGHTLFAARENFEKCKARKLEYVEYMRENKFTREEEYKEIEQNFTFEAWSNATQKYARILSGDTYDDSKCEYRNLEKNRKQKLSCAEKIVIDSLPWNNSNYFGLEYDVVDEWKVFRIVLEAFDSDEEIVLDYTNLYNGGWCDEYPLDEEYDVPKTIILTEGKYDAEVISKSIQILYPYMSKYYSFMNFEDFNVQGSTNFLTHYVKAFISAGIQNRVVAIYDNDSAGRAELMNLEKITCPENFRIMHLPELELANDYPTLGPNGKENMNINGKACSIELFLGRDVLMKDGEFIPIHWKGFLDKTKTYQGEVMQKALIQEKFQSKVKTVLASKRIDEENWVEMRQLLEHIFSLFFNKV